MFYKRENQVANIPTDTGWVITVDPGFADEKKYTIERVEPFQSDGWTEAGIDDYASVYNAMLTVVVSANFA